MWEKQLEGSGERRGSKSSSSGRPGAAGRLSKASGPEFKMRPARDFPCGPVAKTLNFQCRGPRFNS